MEDIGRELSEFIERMRDNGPQKTGLMQYFKNHHREIMIMKDRGYTSKQITDFLNGKVRAGKVIELGNTVSVVYFNKAWREFCMKKGISTKPTSILMQEIENEIFNYRDVIRQSKVPTTENTPKIPNPTQETAVQLAELIKFLLELLRQNTGRSSEAASKRVQEAVDEVSQAMDDTPKKQVKPADPDLKSLDQAKITAFFGEE